MIESAVTVLPQPALADHAQRSPGLEREAHAVDGAQLARLAREIGAQAA